MQIVIQKTNLPSQDSTFIQSLEEVIMLIENVRACESEIVKLEEQILALKKVAPLGMSLELLTGVKAIEIFVAEISKPSKVKAAFSEIRSDIELLTSEGILAVACESKQDRRSTNHPRGIRDKNRYRYRPRRKAFQDA